MLHQPTEIVAISLSYLPDPISHFTLKSTCKYLNHELSGEFIFSSINHVVSFGRTIARQSIRNVSKIRLSHPISILELNDMIVDDINSCLMTSLLEGGCDFEWTRLVLTAPVLCQRVLIESIRNCQLSLCNDILGGYWRTGEHRVLHSLLVFDICHMFAKYGTDYQMCKVLRRFAGRSGIVTSSKILTVAVQRRLRESIRLMVAMGADINTSTNGTYPLHIAIKSGSPEIVNFLISLGARVNTRYRNGVASCLHLAVENGNLTMVSILLKHGANKNQRNLVGYTPLDLVRSMIRNCTKRCSDTAHFKQIETALFSVY
jgi:hypothetical protein